MARRDLDVSLHVSLLMSRMSPRALMSRLMSLDGS